MTKRQPRYNPEEHARRGDDIYERSVRPHGFGPPSGPLSELPDVVCPHWASCSPPFRATHGPGDGVITGVVNANHEATIPLVVHAIHGNEGYGGRDFSCRDLEGRLWNIGTYDPWWQPPIQPARVP